MVKISNTSLAEFALSCKYISEPIYHELISLSLEIGKLINMILNPEKFE
jgi:hypothetical protein